MAAMFVAGIVIGFLTGIVVSTGPLSVPRRSPPTDW